MWRAIGSFGIAMVLLLTATDASAQKVNWNDYVEKGPTKYTDIAKNANAKPEKAQPAKPEKQVRTAQPKATPRPVAKAPAKAKAAPKAKAPVRKK